MSNEIVMVESKPIVQFSNEQVNVIKNQIAVGATDSELKSFIWQCERTGLDPFSRQIYFIKSNGKVQIQTSIDGFRLIAERSKQYEGQTQALWCGSDGVWKDIWISKEFPVAAKVGVYKKGFREPLYAVAHWNEYFAQPGYMHKKFPALMLSKVAESLALRKAFPNQMSGLYTQEEMGAEPTSTKVIPDQPTAEDQSAEGLALYKEKTGYLIPFGSLRGHRFENIDIEKLRNAVLLTEKNIGLGKAYSNSSIEEMQDFVDRACVYIQNFEADIPV